MAYDRNTIHPFVQYLETLAEDRGALAALRRGLGCKPGEAPEMFPFVVRWLPQGSRPSEEAAYYLIASLYAYHHQSASTGNFGTHMAATIKVDGDRPAVEHRFVALLKSHPDDLGDHLRQAISYLKSKDQPVNWHQLLQDILAWDHPDHYVQRRWATAFWGNAQTRENNSTETTTISE